MTDICKVMGQPAFMHYAEKTFAHNNIKFFHLTLYREI